MTEREIPEAMRGEADAYREEMLDVVSMFSDELMEAILEGEPDRGPDPQRGSPVARCRCS